MELNVGQRIGDYEILGVLGAGGMGQVFRVRNTLSDRIEAMKVIKPQLIAEPETAARFLAEIRILAGFTHPNIAQLRTAFQVAGRVVMIMELVDGVTLAFQTRGRRIAQQEAAGYVLQVLAALHYAHVRGVVHRDVKPSNLIVTPRGIVKLMDFGVARSEFQARLTRPGIAVGSLQYMSPEQMSGAAVDGRSDLYSVGILLYELITGRRPFEDKGAFSIVQQQLHTFPQPPIEINPLISRALSDLIVATLAKDPSQRIQSAEAFARELRASTVQPAAAAREPIRISPLERPPASRPEESRRDAVRPAAIPAKDEQRAGARARAVTIVDATRPAVSRPAMKSAPDVAAEVKVRPPSIWKRLVWVAAGAFGAVLVAGVAVQIGSLLKPGSPAVTSGGADADPAPAPETNIADKKIAQVRREMVQLQARANADHARLDSHPPMGSGRRAALSRSYTSIDDHLQSAEQYLKYRDVADARKEVDEAQKEISALELNLNQ
jgi:eukaryotic-like serine/threonine-protein kinase